MVTADLADSPATRDEWKRLVKTVVANWLAAAFAESREARLGCAMIAALLAGQRRSRARRTRQSPCPPDMRRCAKV